MDNALSLERLYAGVNQAVLGTDGHKILFANSAAVSALGENILSLPAADIIPAEILEHNSDCFYCASEIMGREAGISVLRENGVLILIMDFLRGKSSSLPLTRAMVIGLRSSVMGLKMSADKCFALIEEGGVPEKRTVSALYHYYYSLLRAITQMDCADHLERGDMPFSPEAVDLVKLCSELADTVSLLCRETGVKVSFTTAKKSLLCMADSSKLEQLLLNLLSNSLRNTSPGGQVKISLAETDGRVIISVDDDGRGLSEDGALRLFSLPEDDENLVSPSGYGLGLYIAYGIAHLHGGTIILESGDKGTRVRVSFPLAEPRDNQFKSPTVPYRISGPSLVLTELADVLDTSCFGPEYED